MKKTRDFIIMARDALKMTQEEFAYAIGRSSRTVRRWEAGESKGTISDAIAIIELCKNSGVEIDTIVFNFMTKLSCKVLNIMVIIKLIML